VALERSVRQSTCDPHAKSFGEGWPVRPVAQESRTRSIRDLRSPQRADCRLSHRALPIYGCASLIAPELGRAFERSCAAIVVQYAKTARRLVLRLGDVASASELRAVRALFLQTSEGSSEKAYSSRDGVRR
jgi:hypothetical protein